MLPKVIPLWRTILAHDGKLWKKFGAVRVIMLTPMLTQRIIRLYVPIKFDLTQGPDTASDDHAKHGNAGAA